jgi:AcrR family transcriptional regulator
MRQGSARTRKRLLEAAGEMFAERGYKCATIAEICERAGTNVAAVNYHFGNKETLYREAWRQSFRDSINAHPPDGGVDCRALVSRRLRGGIAAAVRRMTDKDNREFMIVLKEVANPTGLLEEVMRKEIAPLRENIESLIGEFFDCNSTKEQVRHFAISIIAQCVIPAFIHMAEKKGDECNKDSWRIESIEAYVNHVVNFSLAGMRAIRNAEKNRRNMRI